MVRTARSEDELRLVLVVPPATKGDVRLGGRAAVRIRLDVMELQERPLGAPPAAPGDEGALVAVAPGDGALDLSGMWREEGADW